MIGADRRNSQNICKSDINPQIQEEQSIPEHKKHEENHTKAHNYQTARSHLEREKS